MIYLTGIACFGVSCQLDSCGTWNITKDIFLNGGFVEKDTVGSWFGEYGIEKDKLVPYRDELYNVANHVRVYLDMLADCEFNALTGLFEQMINSMECRAAIFKMVKNVLSSHVRYKEIYDFMVGEFGNAWLSYCYNSDDIEARVKKGN